MKIKYQFINEAVEIEVTEEWANVLIDFDRQEYNVNHKETRRHTTLDNGYNDGKWLSVEDTDITALFGDESKEDRLLDTMRKLKLEQKKLIHAIYFDGVSVSEYATREGVSQPAISQRLHTAIKNLKKLF